MATAILLPTPRPQSILSTMSPSNRRIRFAPLPDPRRSVLIDDDGSELPFPTTAPSQFPAPPTPSPTADSRTEYFVLDSASLSSSSSSSKRNSDLLDPSSSSSSSNSSTPGTATPVSILPSECDPASSVPPSPVSCPPSPFAALNNTLAPPASSGPSPKPRSFQSFFRSLRRQSTSSSSSSSNTLTPVHSIDRTSTPTFSRRNFSAEEILTLGTINLFRASSSRDTSDTEGPSSSTWSLTRWTSGGSSSSHHHHHHHHHHHTKEPTWGSPLARASSTQSYQSPSKTKPPAPAAKKGLRPINRKGTRMLNGRVYGVKQNANPFANARDEEPTFVEWGYGGMGSVKGATSAGARGWERLHGTAASSGPAVVSEDKEDQDDGSGMAWIKKRREQKEKEKREKEEKERLEREALEKAESRDTQTPLPPCPTSSSSSASIVVPTLVLPPLERKESASRIASSRPGTASSARTVVSNASSQTVTPCTSNVSTPLATTTLSAPTSSLLSVPMPTTPGSRPGTAVSSHSSDQEHLTRAVNVPAPNRYHYHHHHRSHSRSSSKDLASFVLDTSATSPKDVLQTPQKEQQPVEVEVSESERSTTSESESESDAERDDDTTTTDSEDDDDSEEEQGREERKRKTALGAGVEKISRHH